MIPIAELEPRLLPDFFIPDIVSAGLIRAGAVKCWG